MFARGTKAAKTILIPACQLLGRRPRVLRPASTNVQFLGRIALRHLAHRSDPSTDRVSSCKKDSKQGCLP